jgi:lipoyl synthase
MILYNVRQSLVAAEGLHEDTGQAPIMSSCRVQDAMTMAHTPPNDELLFEQAFQKTRANHGTDLTFYLPGMIRYENQRGRYPAISLTGNRCELQCEHCKGRLLGPMIQVTEPDALLEKGIYLQKRGAHGLLLSGGSDRQGRLPWSKYADAIRKTAETTGLFLSAHVGFPDLETCRQLKKSGVRQALLDVMGDEETASEVYHLRGLRTVRDALESISQTGLQLAPHIVVGLHYGRIKGEEEALQMLSRYNPEALVFVVLTALKGTPMAGIKPPSPLEVARLIAKARLLMPQLPISLGCERPRNKEGIELEKLALRAGITRMAVWSEEALEEASRLGLRPRFQSTCCSVDFTDTFRMVR